MIESWFCLYARHAFIYSFLVFFLAMSLLSANSYTSQESRSSLVFCLFFSLGLCIFFFYFTRLCVHCQPCSGIHLTNKTLANTKLTTNTIVCVLMAFTTGCCWVNFLADYRTTQLCWVVMQCLVLGLNLSLDSLSQIDVGLLGSS